uniref:Uncharacterized protein n=1 Tax=Vibrio sp. FF_307 TaxID=1652834 RepID=A0A0H3ZL68_9VIBR|nr:hypothetical protein [Vibrio sp. FF_307]
MYIPIAVLNALTLTHSPKSRTSHCAKSNEHFASTNIIDITTLLRRSQILHS